MKRPSLLQRDGRIGHTMGWYLQVLFTKLAYAGSTYDFSIILMISSSGDTCFSDSKPKLLEGMDILANKASAEPSKIDVQLWERPVMHIEV